MHGPGVRAIGTGSARQSLEGIGLISSRHGEEDAAADQEVSFVRTTSIHQQSFTKVVVTSSDRESPLNKGTMPALHKHPTDSIVPKIFWEKGASWIITKPFLTGSLSVVICEIVTEEFESEKKIQKGGMSRTVVAKW
ncbi:hypothetical protein O181_036036 [Austropuccinia psidii MF-1]|uniref:Uncharacterized protein n=1 Tax=Austropuccinia psidii MF-1 TaxID=1389203 RepID=A0A9Q3D3N4_9BASI|nr:hypothetical protein [Austropuccinia psidii MF-1]